jgi:phosphoribosylformylglycinamidine cyclo-ligase
VTDDGLSYRDVGVDIGAGERAVERIKAHVRSTFRPEVVGDIGGFGGLYAFDPGRYSEPVLVSSTDTIGTKALVARLTGRFDTVGLDLVAMCADDVATQGAEPLFFLDCISTGHLEEDVVDALVRGVADGCRQARCALVGGEMAEVPGLLDAGEFDLIGFCVGAVERNEILPRGVVPGDLLVGLESPGLRCNGYSLARAALLERAGRSFAEPAWKGAEHSLADELMRPSVVYSAALLDLRDAVDVHAFAHITGGGLRGNLARVLPEGVGAVLRRGTWEEPRIFSEIQAAGDVTDHEMEQVFNLGIGMIAVVDRADAERSIDIARDAGHQAGIVGEVVDGPGVTIARN